MDILWTECAQNDRYTHSVHSRCGQHIGPDLPRRTISTVSTGPIGSSPREGCFLKNAPRTTGLVLRDVRATIDAARADGRIVTPPDPAEMVHVGDDVTAAARLRDAWPYTMTAAASLHHIRSIMAAYGQQMKDPM